MRWLGVQVLSPAQRADGASGAEVAPPVGPEPSQQPSVSPFRMRRALQGVEGCPSGQREQTVNLPAHAFEGSNPSPSTI